MKVNPGYRTATVRDLMRADGWAPIRRNMGIQSFGANAWAASVGDEVIIDHVEITHEELYYVVGGRATFTVDGEEIDAPAGTLVLVSDPTLSRSAIATAPGTVVFTVGAQPGVPFEPNFWETNRDVLPLFDVGRYEEARTLLTDALNEYRDQSGLLFNLACAESRLGNLDDALDYLRRAVDLRPEFGPLAVDDEDLEPLRDDPRFAEITQALPTIRAARQA